MGLVNEVVDPAELDERALEPRRRDRRQRAAVAGGQQAHHPRAARARRCPRTVERELVELRESCFRTEDFREGVRAFAEKRAPRWRDARLGLRPSPPTGPHRYGGVPGCRRSSPRKKRSRSARSKTTPRSRRWSSAPGRRGVERFGDSTDMCSLVNAKSGGCAEDCGFCAQSRFAEADTPMHAMMTPEQILEHAQAAEAAGAHRFCMVTQGQGLSKRDFENIARGREARRRAHQPQALRLDRPHVRRRAPRRSRTPASSASTTTSRRPRATTRRSPRPSATRAGCARSRRSSEAGLETCVGGILNLGETREQRVEMAFELAKIDPTSVPINLLNPRPGTKFGDRELHGPVGGRQVDRDLPADPPRARCSASAAGASRTSASCSRSRSRPASTA